jgi:hypothetical protein
MMNEQEKEQYQWRMKLLYTLERLARAIEESNRVVMEKEGYFDSPEEKVRE